MPVPASINDLSTTAGNNSPAGGEAPSTVDDYLRTHAAFIAALRDADTSQSSAITTLQSGKQAADPTLTALAGLATGADKLPYFTGADTVAQATLTAFARTLLDDADAAAMRATLGTLGSADIDFTIIYPNGGSAESPATIAANMRYPEANPFPGYYVDCVLEVQINGNWFDPGLMQTAGSTAYGAKASQLNGGDIIVRTLLTGIHQNPALSGTASPDASVATMSAPCRVKVWKVKGATA